MKVVVENRWGMVAVAVGSMVAVVGNGEWGGEQLSYSFLLFLLHFLIFVFLFFFFWQVHVQL